MDLSAWLNFISPHGPCFDSSVNPIPGSPTSLSMIDAVCELYVSGNADRQIHALEVGSHVGISAIAWGCGLKVHGAKDWRLTCCDAWHHFEDASFHRDMSVVANYANAFNHDIFKFNLQKSLGYTQIIELIGDSRKTLPELQERYFDLIYVDGFHGYDVIASDIANALRLCRPGGIICGDDYDCTKAMLDRVPREDRARDEHVLDGHVVHPGVAAAVNELLGAPKVFGTFWAFRRVRGGACAIDVPALPRRIPTFIPQALWAHFTAHLRAPRGLPPGHPFANRP